MPAFEPSARALEAYDLAYERVVFARKEWLAQGSPLTVEHKHGPVGVHPLWKALREAEQDAARRLETVRVKHRGPQAKAVVQASIGESPAAKLRAVR